MFSVTMFVFEFDLLTESTFNGPDNQSYTQQMLRFNYLIQNSNNSEKMMRFKAPWRVEFNTGKLKLFA